MQDAFSSHQTLHHARAHLGLHAGGPSLGPRHRRRARRASLHFRPGVPVHRSTVRNPIRGIGRRLVPARSRGVLLLLPRLRPQRPAFRLGGLPRPRPARLSPLRLPVHAGFLRTARSGLPQHRGPGGLPAASSRHPRNGGHAPGPTPVEASGPDVLRGPQRPHPDRACGRRGRAMERHSAHLPHHQLHPDPLRTPFLRGARRRSGDCSRGFSAHPASSPSSPSVWSRSESPPGIALPRSGRYSRAFSSCIA